MRAPNYIYEGTVSQAEQTKSILRYLIYSGKMTKANCKIGRNPGNKRLLVNTEPWHDTGKRFHSYYEFNGIYLNTNFNAGDMNEIGKYLLWKFDR